MRGLIQKRGSESWRIRAYVGRDANGTKRYVSKTVHGTRKDAERDLSRLLVEVDEGRHAAAAPMTVGGLLDRWLAVKKLAVEPTTLSSYEWVARTYLRSALGDRKLAAEPAYSKRIWQGSVAIRASSWALNQQPARVSRTKAITPRTPWWRMCLARAWE